MEELRCGVIGYGNMGTAHAACIAEGHAGALRLTAVCDIDPRRLEAARAAYPGAAIFDSAEALVASGACDAVIVAAPHPLHAELASLALKGGLHVLVEKPIDVSVSKAKALCGTARQSGRLLAVMLNQRTNPLFRKARELVRSGELGELKRTTWIITNWYRTQHYYDSGAWRATWAGEGGGVLLNQCPHQLDLWQWICGMPVEVTAWCQTARYHRIEVEDDAMLLTRYANGAMGQFITSTGESPGTNRLEIVGDRGKLVLENGRIRWQRLRESEREVCFTAQESFVTIPLDEEELLPDGPETAHPGILRNFGEAVLHGEPLIGPGDDAVHELMLSNAAYLSQWQGHAAVSLPFDEALFDRLLAKRAAASVYRDGCRTSEPDGRYNDRWQVKW